MNEPGSRIDVPQYDYSWARAMTNKLVEQNALILKANIDLIKVLATGPFIYPRAK